MLCQLLWIFICAFSTAGVAYSRHIVQLYSYHGGEDMRQHLEVLYRLLHFYDRFFHYLYITSFFFSFQIDAHVGGVNDIAFSTPNKQLCFTTCGDDKTIKVQSF